jgi:DNA anti-recombination protein RmuC
MNAADRKVVADVVKTLEDLQKQFEQAQSDIGELASSEQDKFDNMSEGLQQGDTGQKIEAAATTLQEAADEDGIQSMIDKLGELE